MLLCPKCTKELLVEKNSELHFCTECDLLYISDKNGDIRLDNNRIQIHEGSISRVLKAHSNIESFIMELKHTVPKNRNSRIPIIPKVDRAIKMFSTQEHLLFMDSTENTLRGIVRSQTEESKEYVLYLNSRGNFFCCDSEYNNCWGLRGKICMHIILGMIAMIKT